jgi:hypothetical protein
MKGLINEVRFDEGGVVVRMRESAGEAAKLLAIHGENVTN